MRVAYVVGTFPCRSETFIAREVAALAARGLQVEVFPLWGGEEQAATHSVHRASWLAAKEQFLYMGKHTRWQLRFLGGLPGEGRGALQAVWHEGRGLSMGHAMRRLGVEWVHAHFASLPSTLGWMAADVAGVPFSVSVHARDVFVEAQFLPQKARAAQRIVACNSAAAERTRERVDAADAGKVVLVPHGVPLEEFPFREAGPGGPPLVLGVGRLVEKKGFPVLLQALAVLRTRGVEFRALLIGEGPQRHALEAEIVELGLTEPVALTGWLPQDRVREAYRRASVLVAPSVVAADGDRDGLPNVVLEAAATGVPLVTTDVGGLPDLVRDGETGLVAPPGDGEALAERLRAVLDSREEAMTRSRAARAAVEERFDIRHCADQLIAALELELPSG